MQAVRTLVLRHVRLACRRAPPSAAACGGARPAVYGVAAPGHRGMTASAGQEGAPPRDFSEGAVRARVVEIVKKFDKIDAGKMFRSYHNPVATNLEDYGNMWLSCTAEQNSYPPQLCDIHEKIHC